MQRSLARSVKKLPIIPRSSAFPCEYSSVYRAALLSVCRMCMAGISVYPSFNASSNAAGVYASGVGPGDLVEEWTVHSAVGTSAPSGERSQRYDTVTLAWGARPELLPNSIPLSSPADDSLGPK